jgi:type II secretory pathway component PulL
MRMKRAIGIDINKKHISLVQLCNKGGKYFCEKNYVQDISDSSSVMENSPDEVQKVIKKIIDEKGFDTKALAIISMPFGRVFFHNYKTELSTDRDIEQLIKFELEDDFPIPFDDIITDIYGCRILKKQEREFLIAAVSRSKLHDWTQAISEAGLNCTIVTSDVCALSSFTTLNRKANDDVSSMIIYAGDGEIITAVIQNHSTIFARHIDNIETQDMINTLKRDISLTLKAVFDSPVTAPSKILLCGSPELVHKLYDELSNETNFEVQISNPFTGIRDSGLVPRDSGVGSRTAELKARVTSDDYRLIIALGLALIGMDNESRMLNFLACDKAGTREKTKTKRNAIVFAFLLLALAAMFLVNLFTRLRSLENENRSLGQEIRQIFVQTFPDEKKIVNELAQMNEKYDVMEQEYHAIASEILDRVPILEIFEKVSEKITPNQNIRVSSISMTPDSVQLSATAIDFESIDNLVEKLKQISLLDTIDIKNLDIDQTNNWVSFNLSITIGVN